jgi:hypothetical protein
MISRDSPGRPPIDLFWTAAKVGCSGEAWGKLLLIAEQPEF